jgi:RimJ/RimL family protein N-acetyltransferase
VTIQSPAVERLPGTDKARISSGRVTLRCFTRADLDRRCAWPPYEDPVFDHLNLHLFSAAQRDVWYAREWEARKPFWFAVDDETGELIGSITLRDVSRWRRMTRLGIHLHPQRLGQGYGTEALRLFLDYYFGLATPQDALGYNLLKLDVAAYNKRAVRCYEKLGFRFVFEFWRPNMTGIEWLKDDRFAHVREHVERRRGMERVRHYEMHLDARAYRERRQRAS